MTYLELVNNVLKRLRERTVTTVAETEYSQLIGILANDALQDIENMYEWGTFRVTLSGDTTAGIFNYELNGSGQRMTFLSAYNDTSNWELKYITQDKMNEYYLFPDAVEAGPPKYFTWNGTSLADNDTKFDVYPVPDGVYTLRFNIVQRQPVMELDTDVLGLPHKMVEQLTYAKAIEERGEDMGISSSSAYKIAYKTIGDMIQLDALKHPEEMIYRVS